jgi:hypothetical protein
VPKTQEGQDPLRLKLTFGIAAIGIGAVLLAFTIAVLVFSDANEPAQVVVAVLGPLFGVIGTLAGYVAGQTAGAAGKEKAEERAASAQDRLEAVAKTGGTMIEAARREHPDLFPDNPGG